MSVKSYGTFGDFEIRDCTYFGEKPDNIREIRYDIVKWIPSIDNTGESVRHCFSIGTLEWDDHEPQFELKSVGTRWLEYSTLELNHWLLKWCDMMKYKILFDRSDDEVESYN